MRFVSPLDLGSSAIAVWEFKSLRSYVLFNIKRLLDSPKSFCVDDLNFIIFSPHFISHLIIENFLANRKILIELVLKDNLRAIADFISNYGNEISSLAIDLFLFEMARREFNISRGIYLYSPNICSTNCIRLRACYCVCTWFDIFYVLVKSFQTNS